MNGWQGIVIATAVLLTASAVWTGLFLEVL